MPSLGYENSIETGVKTIHLDLLAIYIHFGLLETYICIQVPVQLKRQVCVHLLNRQKSLSKLSLQCPSAWQASRDSWRDMSSDNDQCYVLQKESLQQACHAQMDTQRDILFPRIQMDHQHWQNYPVINPGINTSYILDIPGSATCVCHSKEAIGGIFQGVSDISDYQTCTISILFSCTMFRKSHLQIEHRVSKPQALTFSFLILKPHSPCSFSFLFTFHLWPVALICMILQLECCSKAAHYKRESIWLPS